MFRSRQRARILSQFDHSVFSGMLAQYWGNADFDRPALDFEAFVRGVTLHDWHYGVLDAHPLGEYDDAEWRAIAEAGVAVAYDDPVTDAVAKRHLRRLIGTPDDTSLQPLIDRLEARIGARRAETRYTDADFEWADRITRFCDSVAFDLGFENRGRRSATVQPRRDEPHETEIAYEITPDSTIRFDPWPFAVTELGMPVPTYDAGGYPEQLTPQIVLVRCLPAA